MAAVITNSQCFEHDDKDLLIFGRTKIFPDACGNVNEKSIWESNNNNFLSPQARWIYRVEDNDEDTINPKQECLDWYRRQPDPVDWNHYLGTCPCATTDRGGLASFSRRLGQELLDEIAKQNGETLTVKKTTTS